MKEKERDDQEFRKRSDSERKKRLQVRFFAISYLFLISFVYFSISWLFVPCNHYRKFILNAVMSIAVMFKLKPAKACFEVICYVYVGKLGLNFSTER